MYPVFFKYSETPKLGRKGFDEMPTTAIVFAFLRISRIGSAAGWYPSGSRTIIVPFAPQALPGASPRASIYASLPETRHSPRACPPKLASPPEIPSSPAAARSLRLAAAPRRILWPSDRLRQKQNSRRSAPDAAPIPAVPRESAAVPPHSFPENASRARDHPAPQPPRPVPLRKY